MRDEMLLAKVADFNRRGFGQSMLRRHYQNKLVMKNRKERKIRVWRSVRNDSAIETSLAQIAWETFRRAANNLYLYVGVLFSIIENHLRKQVQACAFISPNADLSGMKSDK